MENFDVQLFGEDTKLLVHKSVIHKVKFTSEYKGNIALSKEQFNCELMTVVRVLLSSSEDVQVTQLCLETSHLLVECVVLPWRTGRVIDFVADGRHLQPCRNMYKINVTPKLCADIIDKISDQTTQDVDELRKRDELRKQHKSPGHGAISTAAHHRVICSYNRAESPEKVVSNVAAHVKDRTSIQCDEMQEEMKLQSLTTRQCPPSNTNKRRGLFLGDAVVAVKRLFLS